MKKISFVLFFISVLMGKTQALYSQIFTFGMDSLKNTISYHQIGGIPGNYIEPIQALSTLPGVVQMNESAQLFVRGGKASETAFIIDNAYVKNPYRLNTPTQGGYSIFRLENTPPQSFETNGYSSQYGTALSGIVKYKSHDMIDSNDVNVKIGLTGIEGNIRQRMSKINTLNFSASYINTGLLYELSRVFSGNAVQITRKPSYYEILLSNVYQYSETGKLKVYTYSQGDDMEYLLLGAISSPSFSEKSFTIFANISLEDKLADKLYMNSNMAYSYYLSEKNIVANNLWAKEDAHLPQFRLSFLYAWMKELTVRIGIDAVGDMLFYTMKNATAPQTITAYTIPIASFIEAEGKVDIFEYRIGGRFTYEPVTNQFYAEPNAIAKITLSNNISLWASYRESRQYGTYILKPFEMLATVTNAQDLISQTKIPERSWQISLGGKYQTKHSLYQLEGFYKEYSFMPMVDNTTYSNVGKGTVWGIEFLGRQNFFDLVSGWISYTFLISRSSLSAASPTTLVTSPFDVTHTFNLVGEINYGAWIFGISYRFSSGVPYNITITGADRTDVHHNLSTFMKYQVKFINGKPFFFYLNASNLFRYNNSYGYINFNNGNGTQIIPIGQSMLSSVYFGMELHI